MEIDSDKYLDNEEKINIINEKIISLIVDVWLHSLNKKVYMKVNNKEGIKQSESAIKILEEKISSYQDELDVLKSDILSKPEQGEQNGN